MELKVIAHDFSVCKVKDYSQVDLSKEYCFTGKTDEEKFDRAGIYFRQERIHERAGERHYRRL